MTDIVPVPDQVPVPVFPALGAPDFNQAAYAFGSAMPGVSTNVRDVSVSARTNAIAAQERATSAASAQSGAQASANSASASAASAASSASSAASSASSASGSASAAQSSAVSASSSASAATTQANRAQDIVDSISNITTGPVLAFNNRTGAVTLNASDVEGALGYLPVKEEVILPDGYNLNAAVVSGFYRLNNPLNGPPNNYAQYGQMIVSEGAGTICQIASGHDSGFAFIRQGYLSGSTLIFTRWIALGKKPVNVIADNGGYMVDADGVSSFNALNVMTFSGATTKRLPKSPMIGDSCAVIFQNGRIDNVIQQAETGELIMGLSESITIDKPNLTVNFVFVNSTYGWRIV